MKLDDMYEPNRRGEAAREGGKQSGEGNAPLADREVPLPPVATMDHIHRWLDGEAPEPPGLRARPGHGPWISGAAWTRKLSVVVAW